MSNEIFDIPETEKPKKKKREMTPEAKAKLLDRLRAGRERAKAKREGRTVEKSDNKTLETVSEIPTDTEVETDYKTTDEDNQDIKLDNDDVSILAREIEELETKVNGYKKKEKKKKVGNIVSNYTKKRNQRIDNLVEQKVNERMAKMNKPVVTAPPKVQPVVSPPKVQQVQPQIQKIQKPSKFSNTIRPSWAKNWNI
tara:strand:- start:106 stop:696 length:591 start_codon:yes stop_codon:yes gene_type:complete